MTATQRFAHAPRIAACLLAICVTPGGLLSSSMASDPTGVWRGEWTSGSTSHRGPMRVAVRPNGNGTYQARFTGRFALVVPFMYQTTLIPSVDAAGNVHLSASKRLGFGLGNYTMHTTVVGNQFYGSFSAAGDRGRIHMRRVR